MKIFLYMLIAVLGITLTSCDKDDNGKIEYTNWLGYDEDGIQVNLHFKMDSYGIKYTYSKLGPPGYIEVGFKYKLKGNKVEIYNLSGSPIATGIITDKTMTVEFSNETIIFKRE